MVEKGRISFVKKLCFYFEMFYLYMDIKILVLISNLVFELILMLVFNLLNYYIFLDLYLVSFVFLIFLFY